MSVLAKLTLTDKQKPTDLSPIQRLRIKMHEALEKQIKHANWIISTDGPYEPTEMRYERNPETGQLEQRHVKVRYSPWWWTDETGQLFVSLRYGNKALEIKPNKTAVAVEAEEQLPDTFRALQEAVRAGELDKALEAAAKARKEQFAKNRAKKPAISKA